MWFREGVERVGRGVMGLRFGPWPSALLRRLLLSGWTPKVHTDRAETEPIDLMVRMDRLADQLERTAEAMGARPDLSEAAELLERTREQTLEVVELLQEVREQAEAEVEKGRAQGREIVEQAKALRLTVLRDMARRRQTARVQVERLRAGRDKLMATLGEVRQSIDQSMESAKLSLAEAKVVADTAARRAEDEAEPSDLALLSELDDAQTVGMIQEHDPEHPVERDPVEAAAEHPVERDPVEAAAEHPVECDPVEAAAEHPVLTSAGDGQEVGAIFARLRTRSDPLEGDREIVPDAAKISTVDE